MTGLGASPITAPKFNAKSCMAKFDKGVAVAKVTKAPGSQVGVRVAARTASICLANGWQGVGLRAAPHATCANAVHAAAEPTNNQAISLH